MSSEFEFILFVFYVALCARFEQLKGVKKCVGGGLYCWAAQPQVRCNTPKHGHYPLSIISDSDYKS